ncbi:MAG: hypothetical protein JO019_03565 [Candidatus Kaiserbacteria bacterium]|nr:hypothetical protein [Candidatus Kaiserbacteria bacterium]
MKVLRDNSALKQQLEPLGPVDRLTQLLSTAYKMYADKDIPYAELSAQTNQYIVYVNCAIGDIETEAETAARKRAKTMVVLASHAMKHPEANVDLLTRLINPAAARWANTRFDEEAAELIDSIVRLYRKAPVAMRQAITSAVNHVCRTITLPRLVSSIVSITQSQGEWWIAGDTIVDSLLIAFIRKMITSLPGNIPDMVRIGIDHNRLVYEAALHLVLGSELSTQGRSHLMTYAQSVGETDEVARSLHAELKGRWTICPPKITHDDKRAVLALDFPTQVDEAHQHLAQESAAMKADSWANPHHGKVLVELVILVRGEISMVKVVGGRAPEKAEAA